MKKTFLFLCALCASVIAFGQLKITPNGVFKMNNFSAGNIGNSGSYNVSFGYRALANLSSGNYNSTIGYQALYSNTTGNANTASGCQALCFNTTGYSNTANGHQALCFNTMGYSNTANGYGALYSNTTGNANTANGCYALYSNTTEDNNTKGNNNTANGYQALYSNTTGANNTANGFGALFSNTTSHNNTAIGCYADVSAINLTNATAIGYDAKVNASNKVVIGNNNVISIVGPNNWSIYSDGRTKKNIQANVPGLAFINRLQPVTYNFDLDAVDELQKSDDPKINARRDSLRMARSPEEQEIEAQARAAKEKIVYTGFIAQDVEKTAKSIGYDFSGVDAPENGKGVYGLRYAEFVVPLVKAVQELSEQVNELKAEIAELKLAPQLRSAEVIIDENGGGATSVSAIDQQATLYQNTPNPFNQSTQIKFYVPETVSKALLCIYDLQGKQLKQTLITQRGYGIETVFASEFTAGIYLYALLAEGNQVDVKRMILTE